MASKAGSAVLIPIRLIQRLGGWALIVAILAFLALFGLQFSHSAKMDTATVIIRLRSYGDPLLYDIGAWVGVSWPAEQGSYTFLPLVVALLTWEPRWVGTPPCSGSTTSWRRRSG